MADLVGRVFAGLQVLQQEPGQEMLWKCRCACGSEITVEEADLVEKRVTSCGCGRQRLPCGDITGMRSGRLVAVEPTDQKRRSSRLWRCRCDCGKEILTEPYKIRSQILTSCGCLRREKIVRDITGQRFTRLVALERLERKRGSSFLWRCQCDCGKIVEVSSNSLLSGNTKSCGCLRSDSIRHTNARIGSVANRMRLVDGTCVERLERTHVQKNNRSGCTGVQSRGDKWIAVISFKKQVHYLGIFKTKEEAIQARKEAEERIFGKFLEAYYREADQKK